MPDVGDWRVATLTVTPFDGTTVAMLTVVAPNGTTSTPAATPSGGGATWTAAAYEFTARGAWVEQWTVTGTGQGAQASTVLVDAMPPTTIGLASTSDIELRLGRVMTDAERARAAALLTDATALIRSYTRQQFTAVAGDVVNLRPVGTRIRLPQRPVTAVSDVTAIGWAGIPNLVLPFGFWGFDGIDTIEIAPFNTDIWLNLPIVQLQGTLPDTYRVTYSHGSSVVPDDVIAVCCSMVLRVLMSPSRVEGMGQERIGEYSYQIMHTAGAAGASARLTEQDKDALAKYRRSMHTIEVRA